jgi:hypothetical protein
MVPFRFMYLPAGELESQTFGVIGTNNLPELRNRVYELAAKSTRDRGRKLLKHHPKDHEGAPPIRYPGFFGLSQASRQVCKESGRSSWPS